MLAHNQVPFPLPDTATTATGHGMSATRLLTRRTGYQVWAYYGAAILLFALLFGLWQVEPVPANVHFVGVLVAAVCLFPFALWFARGSREAPMFELICIAYLLAFCTPLYLQPNGLVLMSKFNAFDWDSMGRTLWLVLLGITAMLGGYYGLFSIFLAQSLPHIDLPLTEKGRLNYIRLALPVGFGAVLLRSAGFAAGSNELFGNIWMIAQNQINIVIVVLSYYIFGKGLSTLRPLLYLCIGIAALLGISSGMLEGALIPLVLFVVVLWHSSGKLPWSLLVGGFFLFIMLNSVKGEYRARAWYSSGSENLTLSDRVGLWVDLGSQQVTTLTSGDAVSNIEATVRTSTARLDLLHFFTLVQEKTPDTVPYYRGETYSFLFYGWIPRFLWPTKPIAQQANKIFAVDYGIQTEAGTETTMFGIGHLPEAYANFGIPGLIIIMMLEGGVFALLNYIFNGPNSDGGRAIYIATMVWLLNGIGSNTAFLLVLLLINVGASSLIMRHFASGWRQPSGQRGAGSRRFVKNYR